MYIKSVYFYCVLPGFLKRKIYAFMSFRCTVKKLDVSVCVTAGSERLLKEYQILNFNFA